MRRVERDAKNFADCEGGLQTASAESAGHPFSGDSHGEIVVPEFPSRRARIKFPLRPKPCGCEHA